MSRDAAYLFLARIISAGTTVALLSLVGHLRGGDDFGLVATGLAVGALLAAATDAGTSSLLVREGARDHRTIGPLLGALVVWRLLALVVATTLLWVLLNWLVPYRAAAVLLVAIGLAIQQFAEMTRAAFIALQRMGLASIHSMLENIIWLLMAASLVALGIRLEVVFAAALGVMLASTAAGFILIAARTDIHMSIPGRATWSTIVQKAAPFAAFVFIGVGYSRVDTLLVGALIPAKSLLTAGSYFAATRLLAALEYLPDAVGRAYYPRLARAHTSGPTAFADILVPAARFLLVVAVPIPAVLAYVGPTMMSLLFGPDVMTLSWLIIPLALVLPMRYLGYLFGLALTSSDNQGRRVMAAASALTLIVGIDALMLPAIGVVGAVVGFLVASAVVFGVYAVSVIRAYGTLALPRVAVISIGAAAAGFGLAWPVASVAGGALSAVIVISVYLAVTLPLGLWKRVPEVIHPLSATE